MPEDGELMDVAEAQVSALSELTENLTKLLDQLTGPRGLIGIRLDDLLDAQEPLSAPVTAPFDVRSAEHPFGAIARVDLETPSEETRRALYALVVRDFFTAQALDPPQDVWIPPCTAEEARLEIVFTWGRYFATWVKPGAGTGHPELKGRELLLLEEDPNLPGRVLYYEI